MQLLGFGTQEHQCFACIGDLDMTKRHEWTNGRDLGESFQGALQSDNVY